MNEKIIHMESGGELVGIKSVDLLQSNFKGESEWSYEGVKGFLANHGIEGCDSFKETLDKLK